MYSLAYINHSQTILRVWVGLDFKCQTIPWVQFCYDLDKPKHTLGMIWHGGMVLPVTPVHDRKSLSVENDLNSCCVTKGNVSVYQLIDLLECIEV